MTVLSDKQIVEGLRAGHVVCRPLRLENIRGASIDLTLGEWFYRCDARDGGVTNPYDGAEVERYFDGPYRAKPYASVYRKIGWSESGWPYPAGDTYRGGEHSTGRALGMPHPFAGTRADAKVIVMRPRERILAHTHEFVGVQPPGTSVLKARSTMGRWGMAVCRCAGQGDPGYVDRWTMELENSNDEAIVLVVGTRIAQLVLYETGEVAQHYGEVGNYQDGVDVDTVVERWRPEHMLPKPLRVEPVDEDLSASHYAEALHAEGSSTISD